MFSFEEGRIRKSTHQRLGLSGESQPSEVFFGPAGELHHFVKRPYGEGVGKSRVGDEDCASVNVGEQVVAASGADESKSFLGESANEFSGRYPAFQTLTITAGESVSKQVGISRPCSRHTSTKSARAS